MKVEQIRTVHIFDLDRTTVCSDHRVLPCYDKNSNLDLQKYINEACTHELIQQDGLLPLADYMRRLIARGDDVAICTARHMGKSDYYFLRKNGLRTPLIMSRDKLHKFFPAERVNAIYNSSDSTYKGAYFDMLRSHYPLNTQFIMYDDHQGVLKAAAERGFMTVDAIVVNQMLNDAWLCGYNAGCDDESSDVQDIIDAVYEVL